MNTQTGENKITVLFVDDEDANLAAFVMNYRRDLNVRTAKNVTDANAILEFEPVDVIVSDQRMPETTGVEFLTDVREKYPNIMRILVTGYSDIEAVIDAINKASVFNYITKPFQPEELLSQIKKAHTLNKAERERDLFFKRSEHMFDVSQNAVILFNAQGKVLDVNPAMEDLLGYSSLEYKHLNMSQIMIDAEGLFNRKVGNVIDPRPSPLLLKTIEGKLLDCRIAAKHISDDAGGNPNYQAIILDHTVAVNKQSA